MADFNSMIVCVCCGARHEYGVTYCIREYAFAPSNHKLCKCGYKHNEYTQNCPWLDRPPEWVDGGVAPLPAPRRSTLYDQMVRELGEQNVEVRRRSYDRGMDIPTAPDDSLVTKRKAAISSLEPGLVLHSGLWTHTLMPGVYYASRERALEEAYKAVSGNDT